MSVWMLILGIFLLLIGCIFTAFDNAFIAVIFVWLGAWFISAYVFLNDDSNNPQAIDVYRGKTTLEITYRDSIPIDSVVVFKEK